MGIYRASFRWPLPPQAATVERYVAALGESAGYPCRVDGMTEQDGRLTATISFPRVLEKNFMALSNDACELEFGLSYFFWAHATHSVEVLGGVFERTGPSERPAPQLRKWNELTWAERVRIRFGFGMSVI